jgi:hypothetical protein
VRLGDQGVVNREVTRPGERGVSWTAAACCRFHRASLLAAGVLVWGLLFERKGVHSRQQAALAGKRRRAARSPRRRAELSVEGFGRNRPAGDISGAGGGSWSAVACCRFDEASLLAAGVVRGDLLFERKGVYPRQQAALAGKRQRAAAVQAGGGLVAVFGGDFVEWETGDGFDPGG